MRKISITIGVPTYLAGKHLVTALESIYTSESVIKVSRIIVVVDGNKISKEILRKIKHPKLKISEFKARIGQSQRMNTLMKEANSDLLILTNDDVVFDKNTLENVIAEYKNSNSDLITARVYPLEPKSLMERLLKASADIKRELILSFPNSQTYLNANGRFLVLSKKLYKNIELPKGLINSDAYIYFFAIKNKYKTAFIDKICCYFREPAKLSEHINQVQKFQLSFQENSKYFGQKFLAPFYKIPILSSLKANFYVLLNDPIDLFFYFMVFIYVRVTNWFKLNKSTFSIEGYWETDYSTKNI